MTDATNHPDPDSADERELDERALHDVVGRLVDYAPPVAARRAAHIDAALAAFDDELALSTDDSVADLGAETVTDLATERARRRLLPDRWTRGIAAAAAVLVVAAVGVRFGSANSDDEMTADSAAAPASTEASRDATVSDESAEASADMSGFDANAGADAYAATAAPAAAVTDLGSLGDIAALREAVSAQDTTTTIAGVDESAPPVSSPQPASGPVTESALEPAPAPPGCSDLLAGLGTPRFTAVVNGQRVVVVESSSDAGGAAPLFVVDQTTCSVTPL